MLIPPALPSEPQHPQQRSRSVDKVLSTSLMRAGPVHDRGVGTGWYFRSVPIQAMITKKTTDMRHVDKPLSNVRLFGTNLPLLVLSSVSF